MAPGGNTRRGDDGDEDVTLQAEQAVRERAYAIWETEGCPSGRDAEHWCQARTELLTPTGRLRKRPAFGAKAAKPSRRKKIA